MKKNTFLVFLLKGAEAPPWEDPPEVFIFLSGSNSNRVAKISFVFTLFSTKPTVVSR